MVRILLRKHRRYASKAGLDGQPAVASTCQMRIVRGASAGGRSYNDIEGPGQLEEPIGEGEVDAQHAV